MSSRFYMTGGSGRALPPAANDDVAPHAFTSGAGRKNARRSFRRAAKKRLWSCDRGRFFLSQSDVTKAAQDDLLEQLFKEAEKSPTAMAALDWARKHDVTFAVDWQCESHGYYWAGTGLVVISANMLEEGRLTKAVGTLTHEIRHCWQDIYGMISEPTARFDDSFIRTALIEADAYAHGEMAEEEVRLHHNRWLLARHAEQQTGRDCVFTQTIAASCDRHEKELADPKQYLWDRFSEWFNSSKSQGYGEMMADELAYKLQLADAEKPALKLAFVPGLTRVGEGIDIRHLSDLRRLGKTFGNMNYFDAGSRDFFIKTVCSAEKSKRYYDEDAVKPAPRVSAIDRAQLTLRYKP